MTEWEATGIVLAASPFGDGDAVVSVLTEAHGLHRGLVRGGTSRRQRAQWETGNVLRLQWRARLSEQLGAFTGEVMGMPYASVADRSLELALLASCCALARDALAERSPCPSVFSGLLHVLACLGGPDAAPVPLVVRWEATLLAELGFGLSLECCAISGVREGLAFVSPRTGRAVASGAAAEWTTRLLRLPRFLVDPGAADEASPADWVDGLLLTGHFLSREVFGARHRDLPGARSRLLSAVQRSAGAERGTAGP